MRVSARHQGWRPKEVGWIECSPDECVVQFKMENIIDGDMLQQVRLAALYTLSPPHVVAVVRGEAGRVRVYDNDSIERLEGTHMMLPARQSAQRPGTMIAIVKTTSGLGAT